MGFYEPRVMGKRRRGDFFNLGNIVFTHIQHYFSGCEEAHSHPINGGSTCEKRLKAGKKY